ncbi:hypothetical protein VTI28DRAFT_9261 [Corynascus sepedonium]
MDKVPKSLFLYEFSQAAIRNANSKSPYLISRAACKRPHPLIVIYTITSIFEASNDLKNTVGTDQTRLDMAELFQQFLIQSGAAAGTSSLRKIPLER